ncbi:MAG: hypothetical protein D3904_07895 [Candidatus Electrothrix sp. EH2]|nr:hypothetical protein [Candidatus Electrothrix sp. EH2]
MSRLLDPAAETYKASLNKQVNATKKTIFILKVVIIITLVFDFNGTACTRQNQAETESKPTQRDEVGSGCHRKHLLLRDKRGKGK